MSSLSSFITIPAVLNVSFVSSAVIPPSTKDSVLSLSLYTICGANRLRTWKPSLSIYSSLLSAAPISITSPPIRVSPSLGPAIKNISFCSSSGSPVSALASVTVCSYVRIVAVGLFGLPLLNLTDDESPHVVVTVPRVTVFESRLKAESSKLLFELVS